VVSRITGDSIHFAPSSVEWRDPDYTDRDRDNSAYFPLSFRPRMDGSAPSSLFLLLSQGPVFPASLGGAWDSAAPDSEALEWDVRSVVCSPVIAQTTGDRSWVQITEEVIGGKRCHVHYHRLGTGTKAGVVFATWLGNRAMTLSDGAVSSCFQWERVVG
jgi:hypothetical protein